MSMSTINGYLTSSEAAEIIGVSRSQVSRYVSSGKLPARRVGQQLLIREKDAKKFKRPPPGNPNFQKN